jgi:hypothetical protein
MLNVKILNDSAQLNSYFYVTSVTYTVGETLTINYQFFDDEAPDNRFMPPASATCTVTFKLNDGTDLVKTADMLFPDDDRSMWTVSLDASETATIVGNQFLAKLDVNGDASDIQQAIGQNVITKIFFEGDC